MDDGADLVVVAARDDALGGVLEEAQEPRERVLGAHERLDRAVGEAHLARDVHAVDEGDLGDAHVVEHDGAGLLARGLGA